MEQELYHHGIQGQKWGVRRYQNPDGSLTPSGKKRYGQKMLDTSKKVASKVKAARVKWHKNYEPAQTISGTMLRGVSRAVNVSVQKKGVYVAKSILASSAVKVAQLHPENTKLINGLKTTGKIVNTVGNVYMTALYAHSAYETARDVTSTAKNLNKHYR